MRFSVSVQGSFYKNIEARNTGNAIAQVITDIARGLVAHFDATLPANIVMVAEAPDPFDKWASVAPQNPARFDVWLAPDDTEWIYDQPRGTNGRYIADDPNTPEQESALRWQPHTQFNGDAA